MIGLLLGQTAAFQNHYLYTVIFKPSKRQAIFLPDDILKHFILFFFFFLSLFFTFLRKQLLTRPYNIAMKFLAFIFFFFFWKEEKLLFHHFHIFLWKHMMWNLILEKCLSNIFFFFFVKSIWRKIISIYMADLLYLAKMMYGKSPKILNTLFHTFFFCLNSAFNAIVS